MPNRTAHHGGCVVDLELATDHQPDHGVAVDRIAFECAHQIAVAQNDDAVGGLDHLVQPVRDEDDRDAVGLETGDHLEQLFGFGDRQAGRRLV